MKAILLLFPILLSAQLDSLKGPVHSVTERLIYLADKVEERDFLFAGEIELNLDYGEFGVSEPKARRLQIERSWFNDLGVNYINNYIEFDSLQRPIADHWYMKNGEFHRSFEYRYDISGNPIHRKISYDGETFQISNSKYGNGNKFLSGISYNSHNDSSFSYGYNVYDEEGNIIKSVGFDTDGKSTHITYVYQNGKNIQINYFYYDNRLSTRKDFRYENNMLIEEERCVYNDDFEQLTIRKMYGYDSKNRRIKETFINESPNVIWEYKYSTNGKLKESTFMSLRDLLTIRRSYKYNPDHTIRRLTISQKDIISIIEFQYRYDQYKNWISLIKLENGKPAYQRVREIKYY